MQNKKILWIEDDADIIGGLMEPLFRGGYKVEIIKSVREYDEKTIDELEAFDIIILDFLIPEGYGAKPEERYSGKTILKNLRKEKNLTIPVLVLTAVKNSELYEEARGLSIAKILQKPIKPSELEKEVKTIVEKIES